MRAIVKAIGRLSLIAAIIAAASCVANYAIAAEDKPNVLFISIDDQNDWIGVLGGHPLAKTPNLDALAARGEVFLNAHCQSPLCNPSRTSLLLGLRPTSTGIYSLAPWFRTVESLANRVSLPQHFRANGYYTMAAGKIYHPFDESAQLDDEFETPGPRGGVGVRPAKKLVPPTPEGDHPLMDWGHFPHRDEDKADYQISSWAVDRIRNAPKDRPFFLAVGYGLPHVPCYATQKWFDLYPDDDRLLPPTLKDDRSDTPRFSWYLHWRLPEPRLKWVREEKQWRNLVRAYLACTSFVDAEIGRVLEALEKEGLADNTLVVVWSDHGWHLGEKDITGKNTLWERSTRVPLIFAGPGVPAGIRCDEPVELLDVFPTLIDLCSLSPRSRLEGHSLLPQLRASPAAREWPAITSHNQGNHSVRTKRWRYIRYADGSEELYDMHADPHEWINLAQDSAFDEVIREHRKWLPKIDRAAVTNSRGRHLTYDKAKDVAVWEGEIIHRDSPIP